MRPITSDLLGDALKLRALLVFAMTAAVLAGCAAEAPPVSAKVQAYYDANHTLSPTSSTPKVPRVIVVGDSYTGETKMGGAGSANWTKLIQSKLNAGNKNTDWDITTLGGSGYVSTGTLQKNFAAGVEESLMGNADIAILFGSRNDATSPLAEVQAIVPKTIARYRERNPSAKLVVVGPTWVTGNPPSNLLAARDAIRDATAAASGMFVDPLADGWFFGADARLIGSDGVHPTDEGHQYIADKLLPVVSAALTK